MKDDKFDIACLHCYDKRYFLGLTLCAAVTLGIVMVGLAYLLQPGLARVASWLPWVAWVLCAGVCAGLAGGVGAILLAVAGLRLPISLYVLAWKIINCLFPFAIALGKLCKIPKYKVQQSFVEVNNVLVSHYQLKVPAERILILTPHCIQWDKCVHKITRNVENCHQCGHCGVGSMLALAHKYGCKFVVATGGTLARQMVKEARPKAIVAVACERDLTSGMQDVFPLPVLGVPNERPYGPCFNTRVDIKKLEEAILAFMEEDTHANKN